MDWRAFDRWTMPADPPPPATGRCTNCEGEGRERLPISGAWIACSECQDPDAEDKSNAR
jgi:hypothetical protein